MISSQDYRLSSSRAIAMPARAVVVQADPDFLTTAAVALRAAGFHAAAFMDSMGALDALKSTQRIKVLVTCIDFPGGAPTGVTLARIAQMARPDLRVLFTDMPGLVPLAEGLGEFLAIPATELDVVSAVRRMMTSVESAKVSGYVGMRRVLGHLIPRRAHSFLT
jgi:FixJ family two-component response regulator